MQREVLFLHEMIDAATRIRELIGELNVDALRVDDLRREAVLWNFTVLGEAAGQVPAAFKEEYPTVGWSQAARLRNRIVHGYWDVDLQILRDTATEDLPTMIEQLRAVLEDIASGDPNGPQE